MKKLLYAALLLLLAAAPLHARQSDAIGYVQTLRGSASVHRGNSVLPVATGTGLNIGDRVRTGKPGAVGIVLTDDTTISLGPESELLLSDYLFAPKEGNFSLAARLLRGTFVYLSGLIGKLAPEAVRLLIPDATIAVRGTKLLVDVQPQK